MMFISKEYKDGNFIGIEIEIETWSEAHPWGSTVAYEQMCDVQVIDFYLNRKKSSYEDLEKVLKEDTEEFLEQLIQLAMEEEIVV